MEGAGTGTTGGAGGTMSAGTPVSVGVQSEARATRVETVQSTQSEANEAVSAPEVQTAVNDFGQNSADQNKSIADDLMETAKVEGVDAALEKLATSEEVVTFTENIEVSNAVHMDGEIVEGELKTDSNVDSDSKAKIEKTNEPESKYSTLDSKPEVLAFEPRVRELENKVDKLFSENEILKNRLGRVEEVNEIMVKSLALMQELLAQQNAQDEEEKKKNQDIFSLLALLIARALTAVLVGPEEAEKIKLNKKESEKVVRRPLQMSSNIYDLKTGSKLNEEEHDQSEKSQSKAA